jgi:LCP family protein required for cell wall assembly
MPIKRKHPVRKRVYLFLFLILFFIGGYIFTQLIQFVTPVYEYTFNKKIELKKTQEQRINILLLGIGGGKHEGPLLTDTIILASIDPEKKKATLVSLPRDLWIPSAKAKINTIYAYSEAKNKGSGLQKTKEIVSEILGQRIDYSFRIDFTGFIKAVDMVNGIDVDISRSFEDYEYPIAGKEQEDCGYKDEEFQKRATDEAQLEAFPCRYEHLQFEKGVTHMDGETALKFVRSRHALGPEGTDFARSQRQEKVIRAFKDKIFSAGTVLNPVKIIGLIDILKDSIDTDIKRGEYDDFVKLAEKMKQAEINSIVLNVGDQETGTPGLLINPKMSEEFGYQWVIIPRNGSEEYTEIHTYVSCLMKKEVAACTITPEPTN